MMPLFWVGLCSTLLTLALSSGRDHCSVRESFSSQNESPLLESLRCYNDYASYVHCTWRKHKEFTSLWFKTENSRNLCVPYDPPYQDEHGTVQCRYKTLAFSIGIKHTVFFLKNATVCSSVAPEPLDLSLHLRAREPANLSTHDPGDGGRRVSWSSPYPSTSSLDKNLTYQLSYRPDDQDNWTTEDVTDTSTKLDRQLLRPGHAYEARVRARASVGQWSSWSPVVTWRTQEDAGQFPGLHCVLDGETEVTCSWEVSRELAHFITYQLACGLDQTAPSQGCCVRPTVSSGRSSTALRYSCSLTVADPARLLLELQPTRRAKTFKAYQHICPNPPQQVKVKEKGNNWMVEWTEPSKASILKLSYQVCYYKTQDQGCSTLLNISEGSTYLTIQGASLAPDQHHQVKVRSLVVPGDGSRYEGIPSEWTEPVDWTSRAAPWSLSTLIYVLISVLVVTVFFTLYCTIPACQRRVMLWVDSVPSPAKSKILCEIKSATRATLQSENTSICKVLHYNTVSTCSSDACLWPIVASNKKPGAVFRNRDNLPAPAEKVTTSDTSSISFSGPYIFCQQSERNHKSVDVEREEKEDEISSDDSLSRVKFPFNGEDYVSLPRRTVSKSTQDLVSTGVANTSTHSHHGVEQHQQCPDNTPGTDKADVQSGLSQATTGDQPRAYTSEPFTPWPQGGTIQASGYFCLPQPK
uniref:Fibronectin type-III domain-containing protein n=1 Tax=Scophthalmus maximus TaxID=52904 RepID=A0A8D3A3A1_SCOMX